MCSQDEEDAVVKAVVPFEASDVPPRLPHEETIATISPRGCVPKTWRIPGLP